MSISKYCSICDRSPSACIDKIGHIKSHKFKISIYINKQRIRQKGFTTRTEAKKWEAEKLSGSNPQGTAESMTYENFLDLYWASHGRTMKDGGQEEKYRHNRLKGFFKSLPLKKMNLVVAEQYRAKLLDEGKAISTINRYLTTLKDSITWGHKRGYIGANVLENLEFLEGDHIRCRWLSDEEINLLLSKADEVMTKIILFSIKTGFRLDNVKKVRVEDINFNTGWITALKTKNWKPYDVPILPSFINILKEVVGDRETGVLFPQFNVDNRFIGLIKDVGLYGNGSKDPNRVTFHTLRHTYAAHLLKKGVDIYTVSKWMGHSSVTITEKVYGHLCKQYQLDQIKNL